MKQYVHAEPVTGFSGKWFCDLLYARYFFCWFRPHSTTITARLTGASGLSSRVVTLALSGRSGQCTAWDAWCLRAMLFCRHEDTLHCNTGGQTAWTALPPRNTRCSEMQRAIPECDYGHRSCLGPQGSYPLQLLHDGQCSNQHGQTSRTCKQGSHGPAYCVFCDQCLKVTTNQRISLLRDTLTA
jgi:hypothetical protein